MTPIQLPLLNPAGTPTRPRNPVFDGATYDRKLDQTRLTKQLDRVLAFMGDGKWHTLRQIADACGCSEASASARLRDLRKKPPHGPGMTVKRARDLVAKGLWHYKVVAQ